MDENTLEHNGGGISFHAYDGDERYIFVSYAHADSDIVFPELERFYNDGFNIWYDEGINPSLAWPDEIARALKNSSLFIVFISQNSIKRPFVQNEIHYALKYEKPFIAIYLEETILPEGIELSISRLQAILKYDLPERQYIYQYKKAFKLYGFEISSKNSEKPENNPSTSEEIIFFEDKKYEITKESNENKKSQNIQTSVISNIHKSKENKINTEQHNSKYLKEFEELNTTTGSIYDLDKYKVLIILKDGTNLTNWDNVKNKRDIIYISEDLSDYTDLSHKYKYLNSLKAIVTVGQTKQITNMKYMFSDCSNLVDINALGKWDTSQVTNMGGIFSGCSSLVDIAALEYWNTNKVIKMYHMFYGCSNLVDIGVLKNWDTSQVIKMNGMFKDCSNLVDIGALENWDTSQVTNMSYMFMGCCNLVDFGVLENWDTNQVTERSHMFEGVRSTALRSLSTTLNLKQYNSKYLKEFEKLNNTTRSIYELGNYKVLIILKDGTNITSWDEVVKLEDIIYVSEDLSDYTDLSDKYRNMSSLKAIVTIGKTKQVINMEGMFSGCSNLVEISALGNWDTGLVTNMSFMFSGCCNLGDIDALKNWNTKKVKFMDRMFSGCSGLIDLSSLGNWDTGQVTNMSYMFDGCSSLKPFKINFFKKSLYPKWYNKGNRIFTDL